MSNRYPLVPLAQHVGIRTGRAIHGGQQRGQAPDGLHQLAIRLGVTHRRARKWNQHGLSEAHADRLATRLGTHPRLVWPTWGSGLAGAAAANALKNTCPQGHAYDGYDNRGYRTCSTCRRNTVTLIRAKKNMNTQVTTLTTASEAA
jgi:hypothetical protein